ncbi:MAG: hypothetical protein M1832_005717 [Thelocarpon impressellum]|nr:MAG: hypothetical protein M1832_005717 [Thelocarpon impressellum]
MAPSTDIVLFHYSFSPYARRVAWYLTLRRIPFSQCMQPPVLPREDLKALGLSYRRIPIVSIGRDIYYDTRLILQKLEERFPDGALGASTPELKGVERLLEKWTVDGGIFARASQLIPLEMPMLRDPSFVKDREDLTGRSWCLKDLERARPEAVVDIAAAYALLESTLLADGRDWILKTEKPSLADIEAVWPFHWLSAMKTALPPSVISAKKYPRVFAWVARFEGALASAKKTGTKPTTIDGAVALTQITGASFAEDDLGVDGADPSGLKAGQDIEFWPLDSGSRHRDRGRLVGLTPTEVVVEAQTKVGGKVVRIHVPRHGFRIVPVSGAVKAAL